MRPGLASLAQFAVRVNTTSLAGGNLSFSHFQSSRQSNPSCRAGSPWASGLMGAKCSGDTHQARMPGNQFGSAWVLANTPWWLVLPLALCVVCRTRQKQTGRLAVPNMCIGFLAAEVWTADLEEKRSLE